MHKEKEIQIKEAIHVIVWEAAQPNEEQGLWRQREYKFQTPVLPLTTLCSFGQVTILFMPQMLLL